MKPSRHKRSVETEFLVPRLLALMVMSRVAPNTPPRITTSQLFVSEDLYNIFVSPNGRTVVTFDSIHDKDGQGIIQYNDDENDTVEFIIIHTPFHGQANITSSGDISYQPDKDFNGIDFVVVTVKETNLLPPFHPLSSSKNISIIVSPMNDAPEIKFESNLNIEETEIQGKIIISILLDGNYTKTINLGHVTFSDVDFADEINITTAMTNTNLCNYSLDRLDSHGNNKKKFQLHLSVDKSFNGITVFSSRGFDRLKFTTKLLEVNSYILISPCIHGNCHNKTSIPCSDIVRAKSFEKYSCKCDVGYKGEWCQTDINECSPNPCSVFYYCEDLIGYQKCNLNVTKTFFLTIGVLLITVMCVWLFRRYYRKKHPTKIDPGLNTWTFGTEYLGQQKNNFMRPASADSRLELIRQSTPGDIDVGIDCSSDACADVSPVEGRNRLWTESTMTSRAESDKESNSNNVEGHIIKNQKTQLIKIQKDDKVGKFIDNRYLKSNFPSLVLTTEKIEKATCRDGPLRVDDAYGNKSFDG